MLGRLLTGKPGSSEEFWALKKHYGTRLVLFRQDPCPGLARLSNVLKSEKMVLKAKPLAGNMWEVRHLRLTKDQGLPAIWLVPLLSPLVPRHVYRVVLMTDGRNQHLLTPRPMASGKGFGGGPLTLVRDHQRN
jgi:hypothetical protein